MLLSKNTALITGGSSGIGFELATQLIQKNNRVIICGRSQEKLRMAKERLPEIEIVQCDISKLEECVKLASLIGKNFPSCNILINNAAIVHKTNFCDDENALAKASAEISTNLTAPIVLSKLFIPIIDRNPSPKLINITTGLIYAPRAIYPFYNATKSALHSFTQVLRMQTAKSPVSVVEVLFPAVNTPWHNGNVPDFAITPEKAVNEMLLEIENGKTEIKIGKVKLLYRLSRIAPSLAIKKINALDKK